MTIRKRRLIIWGIILVLILSSLACSISGEARIDRDKPEPDGGEEATVEASASATEDSSVPTDVPPTEPSDPTAVPPTEAPEPTAASPTDEAPPPPTLPSTIIESEDPLGVADIPELENMEIDPHGMGHLATFRQRMHIEFTADDTGYSGIYNYGGEVNTEQQAVHITLSVEGPAAMELPANTLEAIWISTRVWIKIGRQPWIEVPESVSELPFDEQTLAIGDFLPYVQHFDKVDDREMNNVPCAYYTYQADNVPTQYGTVNGSGDICVALDGGYVVHYYLKGHGTFTSDEYFQGSGEIELTYATYDVGAPIDIRSPRAR